MALISSRTIKIDTSGIEFQLKRIADALEHALSIGKPEIVPDRDFDPDEFSLVIYSDEGKELIEQHLNKRVGGVVVEDLGLGPY